jgi:hypothetical protein
MPTHEFRINGAISSMVAPTVSLSIRTALVPCYFAVNYNPVGALRCR